MPSNVTNEHYLKKELYKLIKTDDKLFDFLEEASLDGLWYWDIEKPENEWMSPNFWRILGFEPKTKKHLAAEWQELINKEDLKTAIDNFKKHCEDPKYPYDQLVRYKHKNGSTVWVRCRGIAIRDENGKPKRMLGAHNNITLLKNAEWKLHKKVEELNKLNSLIMEDIVDYESLEKENNALKKEIDELRKELGKKPKYSPEKITLYLQ